MPVKTNANPDTVIAYAQQLVDSSNYDPSGPQDNPVTHCNEFLNAIANNQWDCSEFANLDANGIISFMRTSQNWTALHDYSKNLPDLAASMQAAQTKANAGILVVCGWSHQPHGHVSLVVKGNVTQSGKWGMEVCFSAQAGGYDKNGDPLVFSNKLISFGYTPAEAISNDFVVYSRE